MFNFIIEATDNELKYWSRGMAFGAVCSFVGAVCGTIIRNCLSKK